MKKALCAALLSLALTPAYADEMAGKAEYMGACASCHGESALGDGPLAGLLNINTPGLTGIAAANDGEFPFMETFMIVDGRTGVRAHGGVMPVWGDHFKSAAGDIGAYGSEVVTRGRIASLVMYLESIQE